MLNDALLVDLELDGRDLLRYLGDFSGGVDPLVARDGSRVEDLEALDHGNDVAPVPPDLRRGVVLHAQPNHRKVRQRSVRAREREKRVKREWGEEEVEGSEDGGGLGRR